MTGDANHDGKHPETSNHSPPVPSPTQQIPHTISSIKLPILKTEGLHKGYDRFQTLLSQLEIHGAGVLHEDANKKFLRSLPSSWSQVALIMRNKPGLDTHSFDDLYNNLRVFEHDVKGTTASSSSNTHNMAFVSANNTSSTNEQINDDDMEEMDLKWRVAMISIRIKKFYKRTRRKLQSDTKDPVGFDKTKVECFNYHKMENFARDCRAKGNLDSRRRYVGYNGNKARDNGSDNEVKSCSKTYEESYDRLKKLYDEQRNKLGDAGVEITAYTLALKRLLNTQMSANDKFGLGYGDYRYGSILSYENEVLQSMFVNKESDLENTSINDRYAARMHAVPPPMIGNYMPSGPDEEIDYSKFTYGPKQTSTNESDSKPSEYASCESDSSVETTTSMLEPIKRNKARLVDYQEFKGGSVAFGGSNGRITGKGKIKDGKLDFKDVYYVEELRHYNLFSVSQKVLFTDTDCLVLSPDFKLPDENQDETTPILKDFIRQVGNQFNHKVKTIRSDNGTEFKNSEPIELCGLKRIKREYSNARTLQQNGVAERKNKTLIKAARTMLAYSVLPTTFWAEAVNTVCYVLNRETSLTKPLISRHVRSQLVKLNKSFLEELKKLKRHEKEAHDTAKSPRKEATHNSQNANTDSTKLLNVVSTPISTAGPSRALNNGEPSYHDDPSMPHLEDIYASPSEGILTDSSYDDEGVKEDGIFNSQVKYVAVILKKFDFLSVKTASTPIETQKPLVKDKEAADVDVTSKTSHLQAVKRIFRYLKGQPKLGLWDPKVSSFKLEAYSNSDYAGANLDGKSITEVKSWLVQSKWLLFWATVAIKKVHNVVKLQVLIDGKRVVVTADVIRQALHLDDADEVECLPNEEIFQELARMGYEKPPPKLIFHKDFLSAPCKFLIHILVQCVSAKRTAWNEFSCSMTSTVICLATCRKFNFSKVGKGFSRVETPLFATIIVQPQPPTAEEEDKVEVANAPIPPSPTTALSPPPQGLIPTPPQVAQLVQDKISQALEILKLKRRVKKLEKKRISKSLGLKRLRKGMKDDNNAAIKDAGAIELIVFDDEEVTMTMAQTLIKINSKKVRFLDEQMAKRLHDEEVEQAAVRGIQQSSNLVKPDKDVEEPQKKRVTAETLLQESFKKLKAVEVLGSHSIQDTSTHDPKEMSKEDVKNMLEIVLVFEFKVEALQVKYPFID
uniref:Integrase catalytic domain-containing protein n=1 Tax=Tanacetum cinerariifolium TaxID=118510 RepID=A0A6L2J563_TANCI|nr:hypothetical protein [Tanacetum cinerariifolium]